jgi:NAD-dependent SIR2 family protein deacetylase
MVEYYCLTGDNNCGCGTNSSNVPHPYHGVTGVFKCPKCNMPYSQRATLTGGAVAATGRHVCPKCGLLQHNSIGSTMLKHAFRQGRCVDDNQPLVDVTQGTYQYCIKCGRIYDIAYAARHGNADAAGMVRCPKCGGNVVFYTAT